MDAVNPLFAPLPAKLSLSAEINTGTRSLHAQLNRLIITRLPLCLPPYTIDPTIYAQGLRHFAHVFLTFESLFADLSTSHPPSASPSSASPPSSPRLNNAALSALLTNPYADSLSGPRDDALLSALGGLLPSGLLRSQALLTDLTMLHHTTPVTLSVALSRFPSPAVEAFASHIRATVAERPHVLAAYAWVFYMALFSGGRWIRAQLVEAGGDFWRSSGGLGLSGVRTSDVDSWHQSLAGEDGEEDHEDGWDQDGAEDEPDGGVPLDEEERPLDEAGLSFLFFPGESDGENIKAEFKARLAAAEGLFSPAEREEVVDEAREIFCRCIELVTELDEIMGTSENILSRPTSRQTRTTEAARQDKVLLNSTAPQGLGIPVAIARVADVRIRNKADKPSRGWLNTAGRVGTAFALGSATWFAVHYFKEQIAVSDLWSTVGPLLP